MILDVSVSEQSYIEDCEVCCNPIAITTTFEHHELVGVKASAIALRNDVPVQRLNRVIRRQPGVLDVEISDDDRILVQLVVTNNQDLVEARKRGLEDVLGQAPELSEAKSNRLRPDQWRLIGGGVAFPVLVFIMLAELLGYHGVLIPLLAVPAVAIGGIQMFREAYGSLRSLQMGFQVLTSLAVIGACILSMWEEALIVTILVAFTIHLEGDALIKAREAMHVIHSDMHRRPMGAAGATGWHPA